MRLLLTALAASVFAVSSVAGQAAERDTLLEQIKHNGVIRVCQAPYSPFNFKNPKTDEWEGMDMDIVKEIAASLNVKIEDIDGSFGTLIPSLSTGKCDISAAATYITPARAEQVLFTSSYASQSKAVFVPMDSPAQTYTDLDKPGVNIVVGIGTQEEVYARAFFKKATIKSIVVDAAQADLLDVAAGRSDATLSGRVGNVIFLKQNPNMKVRIIKDRELDPSPFAFMIPPYEYRLQQYLNIALQSLRDSGKLDAIANHWGIGP